MFSKLLKSMFGNPQDKNDSPNALKSILSTKPDNPQAFGYKCGWLAVKKASPDRIAEKLCISNLEVSNWSSGMNAIYEIDGTVFITPSLDDWTLVVGLSFPDPGEQNELKVLLESLSKEFDEVQYFATHNTVDYHGWAKAINGNIVRAYFYCGEQGEVLWDEGEKSQEEIELDFNFFDDKCSDAKLYSYWAREDLRYPNEEDVMKISKTWSIDTSFESKTFPASKGFIGMINVG